MTLRKLSKKEQLARINFGSVCSADRIYWLEQMIREDLMEIFEDEGGKRIFRVNEKGKRAAEEIAQALGIERKNI